MASLNRQQPTCDPCDQLVIKKTATRTLVARLSDGELVSLDVENDDSPSLVGNVYLGVVVRVLPALALAFVDIGEQRTALLHADDIMPSTKEHKPKNAKHKPNSASNTASSSKTSAAANHADKAPNSSIAKHLHQGQRIIVQVTKDAVGEKGACVSVDIALPARYLVYRPLGIGIGVSSRIDKAMREQLSASVNAIYQQEKLSGSLTVRTAAFGADGVVNDERLAGECRELSLLWQRICQAKSKAMLTHKSPACLHRAPAIAMRYVQEMDGAGVAGIWTDDARLYQVLSSLVMTTMPKVSCTHHQGDIFADFGVDKQLHQLQQRRVDLPLGAYLVIDETEAMAVIDVNSGSFVGKQGLHAHEAALEVNLMATAAIARQIRLRHLSGIIAIDFVDMHHEGYDKKVLAALKSHFKGDKIKTEIGPMNALGIVHVVRQRLGQTLAQKCAKLCTCCQGDGRVWQLD